MVQYPGADNLVERASKLLDVFNRELLELEVVEVVLSLEVGRVAQARLADIDTSDVTTRLAQRISRRLRGATASDEDFPRFAEGLGWPHQVEVRPAPLGVAV